MTMRIIVTGSKGLIGSAVTEYLLQKGYLVSELDLSLGHDLADESFVKNWFSSNPAEALINLFALNDHVDGDRQSNKLMDISLMTFNRFIHVNLTTLFSVCREYARSNKFGSIVNFTSTYGLVSPNPILYNGDEKNIAYGVSKAGVVQLTKHLAVHLAPRFRVNCIAPGGVRHKQTAVFQKAYGNLTPLGRMMEVDELFGIIEFLISSQASYCTGAVYCVDGGWTVW